MRDIVGKVEGNLSIDEDTRLRGMIVGNTVVNPDVFLELNGTVVGSVTLQQNSTVHLYGTVNGDVINRGGYLKVLGMINGKLIKLSGTTEVDNDAIINHKKQI